MESPKVGLEIAVVDLISLTEEWKQGYSWKGPV